MKNNITETFLKEDEIRAILRAADELIMEGGRSLLAKILKGSRAKKVLELELDQCPVYGYFNSITLDEITRKIDWMIDYDFLEIEYRDKLPMIVYTERGWEIESDQRANEFLEEWNEWIDQRVSACGVDMTYLKDRNRGLKLLFIEKVKETRDKMYIPYLKEWEKIDYKKVRATIRKVISDLETNAAPDQVSVSERKDRILEAMKGSPPEDLIIKCWNCGNRFTFTIGEQKFFKQKGFLDPKKCKRCRGSYRI